MSKHKSTSSELRTFAWALLLVGILLGLTACAVLSTSSIIGELRENSNKNTVTWNWIIFEPREPGIIAAGAIIFISVLLWGLLMRFASKADASRHQR